MAVLPSKRSPLLFSRKGLDEVIVAEEIKVLWSKLSFTEEEDEGIKLDVNSTRIAKELGKNCGDEDYGSQKYKS